MELISPSVPARVVAGLREDVWELAHCQPEGSACNWRYMDLCVSAPSEGVWLVFGPCSYLVIKIPAGRVRDWHF